MLHFGGLERSILRTRRTISAARSRLHSPLKAVLALVFLGSVHPRLPCSPFATRRRAGAEHSGLQSSLVSCRALSGPAARLGRALSALGPTGPPDDARFASPAPGAWATSRTCPRHRRRRGGRLRVSVYAERHSPHRSQTIIVQQPPVSFRRWPILTEYAGPGASIARCVSTSSSPRMEPQMPELAADAGSSVGERRPLGEGVRDSVVPPSCLPPRLARVIGMGVPFGMRLHHEELGAHNP